MSRIKACDRIGEVHGKLTIISVFRKDRRTLAVCSCSCGTEEFITRVDSLIEGRTKTCGCHDHSLNSGKRKHGMWNTRVYKIWNDMIRRVKSDEEGVCSYYKNKGISVSGNWNNFENFLDDMGEPPTDNHSIDRINPDGNYCKENCRWADCSLQAKNQGKRNKGRCSSIFKGVTYDKRYRGVWNVSVTKDYTTVRASANKDEILAAKYFNFMTKYLYSDQVVLNKVDDLNITIEQAENLHERLERKFTYSHELKEYKPKEEK